jgi:hypothetical protein
MTAEPKNNHGSNSLGYDKTAGGGGGGDEEEDDVMTKGRTSVFGPFLQKP